MSNPIFKAAGGFLSPDDPTYVVRAADREALTTIERMDFVHLIAPRQMGKTSLLLRLKKKLHERGWLVAYVDLSQLKDADKGRWYASLGWLLAPQLAPNASAPSLTDQVDLKFWLAKVLQEMDTLQCTAIFFDEVGSTRRVSFSDSFFSTLRSMYSEPADLPILKHLTFAFAGAKDPKTLIKDPVQSPFNYGQHVRLDDFTKEETLELTRHLSTIGKALQMPFQTHYSTAEVPGGLQVSEDVHDRIYWWTCGQPYLTQKVCSIIEEWHDKKVISPVLDDPALIDQAVRECILDPWAKDSNVTHIRDGLKHPPQLQDLLQRVLSGDPVTNTENGAYDLYLLGAVKRGPDRKHLVVRNRIYERTLAEIEVPPVTKPAEAPQPQSQPGPYADFVDSLNKGNVVAFVGAGLSIGAGLPGWYELINELAQRTGYELPPAQWATGDALIKAAQVYINERGSHSLVMFLRDRLDTTGKSPTTAHQALARLSISLVLTANYDDLLERAYRDAGKRVHIVVQDRDIPFMRREPDAVNIVKLYGDLDQPDTIVLARQQYEAFFLQRPQMIKLLETELGRSDVLYLGWSHSDPHFNLVFGELLNRFGEFMRSGYAVMFDLPEARCKELERKHIRLVQLPAQGDLTGQLAAWLNSLTPGNAV